MAKDDPNKDMLLEYYQYRCAKCHKTDGVTLHEISPKSLNPKNWQEPSNRIALCMSCHELAHKFGTKASRNELLIALQCHQGIYGRFEDWVAA